MSKWIEKAASLAVLLAALTIAATSLRRELRPSVTSASSGVPEPKVVPEWESFVAQGLLEGDAAARAHVIELADFECPYCARMDESLNALKAKLGPDLAFTFVHFPIPGHRFAVPAARVAECAAAQGKFTSMRTVLFAKQDSLGLKPWNSFGQEAGVPDLDRFGACAIDTARVRRIDAGVELGRRLEIRGTPTLIINGWLYYGLHSEALEGAVISRMRK